MITSSTTVSLPEAHATRCDEADRESVVFMLELGRSLHRYGMPAHRLEGAMVRCAERLGLEAQFFSTPTSLFASFGAFGEQRTYLLRVEPSDVHMEKLVRLDAVLDAVVSHRMGPAEGRARLEQIEDMPTRYRWPVRITSHALVAGTAAVFLGGGWTAMVPAVVAGVLVGILGLVVSRHRQLSRLFETFAGIVAAVVAVTGSWLFGGSVSTIAVSGIIVLVPGLTLTTAINELATRHLVSGTARLVGGMMILVALGFGVAIGLQVERFIPLGPEPDPVRMMPWLELIALFASAWAFMVLFQARTRSLLPMLAAAGLALYGARFGGILLGPELGACLGAFGVGVGSNLFARFRNEPAVVTMLPGLIMLVPGAIGFSSFTSLLDHNVVHGVEAAFRMILVAISIVAGLLLANVAIPVSKDL